jgi:hypothetical protein
MNFILERNFCCRNEKLVDANKEILAERQSELDKLAVQFGGDKGVDMSQFPQIKFTGMYIYLILSLYLNNIAILNT